MAGRVIQGFFIGGGAGWANAARSAAFAKPPPPALVGRTGPMQRRAITTASQLAGDDRFAVDPVRLGLAPGGGRPLPEALQAKMEAAFGADFSAVRVHVGPQPSRIGALAFTTGNDLYFAPGQFQPDSVRGQQLIGHELAHVVQQRQGRVRAPTSGAAVVQDRALEIEADRLGMRAAMRPVVQDRPRPGSPRDLLDRAGLTAPPAAFRPPVPPVRRELLQRSAMATTTTTTTASSAPAPASVLRGVIDAAQTEIGNCGDFSVVRYFEIDNVTADGFIMQHVTRRFDVRDVKNNNVIAASQLDAYADGLAAAIGEYWEFWPVTVPTNGTNNVLDTDLDGDAFALGSIIPKAVWTDRKKFKKDKQLRLTAYNKTTKGKFVQRGVATFYTGPMPRLNSSCVLANGLASCTTLPTLDAAVAVASNQVDFTVTATWDSSTTAGRATTLTFA